MPIWVIIQESDNMSDTQLSIIIKAVDQASATMKKISNNMTSALGGIVSGGTNILTGALGGVFNAMKNIGEYAFGVLVANNIQRAIDATVNFAKDSLNMADTLQQTRIAFETMMGSGEKAGAFLKRLSDFAKKTPFTLPEVQENAKKLLAMGISADEVLPTLKALGDITAGVGKEKLPFLTLALGQVKTAAFLTGSELRQFTENGVPLLEILAQRAGTTVAEMRKRISSTNPADKVPYEEVRQAIMAMTQEGGKFYNLMNSQSQAFSGVMSNISDQLGVVGRRILGISEEGSIKAGGLFDKITQAAQTTLDWLNANGDTIATQIGNLLTEGANRAQEFATNVWPQVVNAFNYTKDVVIPQAIDTFNRVKQWFTDTKPVVEAFVTDTWNKLMDAYNYFNTVVWPFMKPILDELRNTWAELSPVLMDLWGVFQTYIIPVIQFVGGVVLTGLLLAVRTAVNILSSLADGIRAFWDTQKQSLQNLLNTIRETFNQMVDFVRNVVGGNWRGAIQNIINIAGDLGRLKDQAIRWGADLVTGLVIGIGSMAGSFVNRMLQMAKDGIATFKRALGIASPSKVMIGAGVNIVEGLVQGIGRTADGAVNASMGLAQSIVQPFNTNTTTNNTYQTQGASVNVNLSLSDKVVFMNDNSLTDFAKSVKQIFRQQGIGIA